jgi:hypothetical protein
VSAPIVYRLAEPPDLDFVVKSWVSAFKTAHSAGILRVTAPNEEPFSVPCAKCGTPMPHDFAAVMTHTLYAVLARPGVAVWVASNPRAAPPMDLHGYLVTETGANLPSYRPPNYELVVTTATEPMVHFCFVKRAYRGFGLAAALFRAAGVDPAGPLLYSCKTADVSALERAGKLPRARWSPLSVRFTKQGKSP